MMQSIMLKKKLGTPQKNGPRLKRHRRIQMAFKHAASLPIHNGRPITTSSDTISHLLKEQELNSLIV